MLQFHEFVIDINIFMDFVTQDSTRNKISSRPWYFLVGLTSDRGRDLMMVIFQPSVARIDSSVTWWWLSGKVAKYIDPSGYLQFLS